MILFYFLVAFVEIIASLLHLSWLVYATKPLLMILLGVFFYQNTQKPLIWTDKVILLALFFSWCGDVFLMLDKKYFVYGLGSFLLAHVSYILVFSTRSALDIKKRIPVFVYTLAMIIFLKKYVPENMFIPVLVYALTIGIMGMRALERKAHPTSYQSVAIGAILFIFSDTLIAIHKFVEDIPLSSLWIMATYVLGQYFIVKGILEDENLASE
jgi:uncharacterized membrane protein YhhN